MSNGSINSFMERESSEEKDDVFDMVGKGSGKKKTTDDYSNSDSLN